MGKRLLSALMIVAMVVMMLPVDAFAANSVMINSISDKVPGDTVTISGTTSLDEVSVVVLRPNDTHLYTKVLKGPQFTDTFTLPSDSPTGLYTVVVGQGSVVATTTFLVVDSKVTISDVEITIDEVTKKVIVKGKVSSGSGNEVTIQVYDPYGDVDFVGQTTSGEEGRFTFEFTPYAQIEGTYTVKIGAEGMEKPYETTFEYKISAPIRVTKVTLDKHEAKLKKGETLQLTAKVEPENATNKAVTWSSSNENVAIVDENGLVTALGEGAAIITVTTVDGGFTDICAVIVEDEEPGQVTVISDVTVDVDYEADKIIVNGKVSSGNGKDVTILVLDPHGRHDYIGQTVSRENGEFTFVFALNVKITGKYTVKLGAVGVEKPYETTFDYVYEAPVPVEGVTLDKHEAKLKVGETLALTATVEPENATNKALIWSSSNEDVATVDENGVVTAKREGVAVITVTTVDGGYTDTCMVIVEKGPVPVVVISDVTVDVDYEADKVIVNGKVSSGSGKEVAILVLDPNGDDDYIGQTTSGEDGKFTFIFTLRTKMTGTYTVKLGAVGVEKPYEATFDYVHEVRVTKVTLDKHEAKLKVGETLALTAKVEPENATNKAVLWSSNNEEVATVDENGLVTALGEGVAIITVTTVDGGLTDTCMVIVEEEEPGQVTVISDVTVDVDYEADKVIVKGKVSSGSGKDVTLLVLDPNGRHDYIGQTISGENGEFTFIFALNVKMTGKYTIKLGAVGMEKPYETTFDYVYEVPVPVEGVTLDKHEAKLKVGETIRLTAKVEPENATNKAVIWRSSNDNIATVDENGVVTAKKEGVAVITVTTVDGGYTDTCTVTVEKTIEKTIISDVTVNVDYAADKIIVNGKVSSGSGKEVTIHVLDPNGDDDYVGQTTSGEGGAFTFVFTLNTKMTGTYTIKLGAFGVDEPYKTTFDYVHIVRVTKVILDKHEAKLKVGETLALTAKVEPENATNKAVLWSSSNEEVATVNVNGVVTAKREGVAVITVTTVDGGYTDTCMVIVEEEEPGQVTVISDVTVKVDYEADKIIVNGKVSSGSGKAVTILVLDPDGKQDYIGQTVSRENGEFTFVFTLNIKKTGRYTVRLGAVGMEKPYETTFDYVYEVDVPVEGVTLDKHEAKLKIGETLRLTATVKPENATNKKVHWRSSNDNIASVDENGVVTAKSEGIAVITVITEDGGFTDACTITVESIEKTVISDVTINVDYVADKIIVKGKVSSGSGKEVTICVLDPNGDEDYVGQTTSGEGGAFTFRFTLNNKMTGTYTVKLGAEGMDKPYVTTFEYNISAPIIALTGPDSVLVGDELAIGINLVNVKDSIYAQDITITYDSSIFDYVKTDSVNEKIQVVEVDTAVPGTIRFILASAGEQNGISENAKLLDIIFKTKDVVEKTDITVKKAILADKDGNEIEAVTTKKTVSVTPIHVTGVTLNITSQTIYVNDTLQLIATVKPENATNKKVFWSSNNESVATVDQNGLVTAISTGTAIITVTTEDGGFTAECTITVESKSSTGGGGGGGPTTPRVVVDKEGKVSVESIPTKKAGTSAIATPPANVIKEAFNKATAGATGEKRITLNISQVSGAKQYEVEFDADILTSGSANEIIDIQTPFATVSVPRNMFASSAVGSEKLRIVVGEADKANLSKDVQDQVGDRPVIDLYAKIGNNIVNYDNPNAPVTVSIPYILKENEDPEHIVVWYIDGNGNVTSIPNGRYDKETGRVVFTVTHFSIYGVAYVQKTFADLDNHPWAKKAIEVMASKGIIKGTSETTYSPGRNITRADFISLIVRTLELKAEIKSNFADVKATDYFYKEVGIAKELGIVKGVGDNKFDPNADISRQDMMVMVANALKYVGKLSVTATAEDISGFKDASKVSDYAVESVAALVKDQLIVGYDNMINPLGTTTRAEVAVIIYRIYNKFMQ